MTEKIIIDDMALQIIKASTDSDYVIQLLDDQGKLVSSVFFDKDGFKRMGKIEDGQFECPVLRMQAE